MSERIDAYAHIGLPRFATAEELLKVMDRHGMSKAIVAAADTCPDIAEVARAIATYPDRLRGVGVPLGNTFAEISASLRLQAESGFLGIRIFDRTLAEHPRLLEVLAGLGLVPYVVGGSGLAAAAQLLVDYLDGGVDRLVVAPHFGGGGDPAVFDTAGPVRDLFAHPRFLVIFSRHGAYESGFIHAWARALVARIGSQRILFGSEFPVCLWRNESYRSTLDWIRSLGPALDQDAFYGGNALGSLWMRPLPPPRRIDPVERFAVGAVQLFSRQGLEIPEEAHRKLLARYLAGGEPGQDYRAFITRVLIESSELLGGTE